MRERPLHGWKRASRAHKKRKELSANTYATMTMRSPQRKRGAGAAWRLACALLITVHAAAAHERPAAAIANALVVANEQRASIDVPSATKSDAGSSSAGLQSVALLYRGATNNLAPVVGSALLLASAVPARSSAWRAPVFGYLLFPGGFVRAAAVRGAARDNTINNFPSVATGVVPQERRQLSVPQPSSAGRCRPTSRGCWASTT